MKKRKPSVSDRAVEFILTRKLEELGSLTETSIAQAIGVNISYLSRKFEGKHKVTLNDFIVREKIHTAIFILEKHQEVCLGELSVKLGFVGINRFIEAFKNYVGVEPLTYRQLKHKPGSLPKEIEKEMMGMVT